MIKLFIGFICLLTAILLGGALSHDPGYVLIHAFNYQIETTVTVLMIALIIVFFILHQLLCLYKFIKNIPKRRRASRAQKALQARCESPPSPVAKGQALYLEGNASQYIRFYEQLSWKQQKDPLLLAYYACFIDKTKAEKRLRKGLQKNYSDVLIDTYGRLFIDDDISSNRPRDDQKAIAFAESLLATHAQSAALHLCLGRLNHHAKLWGKAQHHLKESLELHPCPEAYQALADLYTTLGNKDNAYQAYQQGLKLSLNTSILAKR